jgi:hypothetical protein
MKLQKEMEKLKRTADKHVLVLIFSIINFMFGYFLDYLYLQYSTYPLVIYHIFNSDLYSGIGGYYIDPT